MSKLQKNTDVNRTVDGDTAEGHARVTIEEAELRTGKRMNKRTADIADDTADDIAEGHGVLKAR